MNKFTQQEDNIIRKAVEEANAEGKPHDWRKKAVALLPNRSSPSISNRKAAIFKSDKPKKKESIKPTWRIELEDGRRVVAMAKSATDAMAVLHPSLLKQVVHINRQ